MAHKTRKNTSVSDIHMRPTNEGKETKLLNEYDRRTSTCFWYNPGDDFPRTTHIGKVKLQIISAL